MVNLDIPIHYTVSPSSHSHVGTPLQLTINRDATVDLDSSNAFEGPEKLLEVWFSPSSTSLPAGTNPTGLKAVPAHTWTDMLDLVHCKVLSIIESEHVDAYLLSESSMFVFPHKLVLKTCGTTTLLLGLPRMLEIAKTIVGFPGIVADPPKGVAAAATPYRVFYSRKNFLFPNEQKGPHRSWRDEVKFLDRMFLGGSAYMIGKMNGEHWYLYLTGPDTQLTPPASPVREYANDLGTETKYIQLPQRMAAVDLDAEEAHDETLEVLMTDLDEENAKQFYLENASAVAAGRFFQKARETRKEAIRNLGTINEAGEGGPEVNGHGNMKDSGYAAGSDDVFDQTSPNEVCIETPDDEDEPTVPDELATEGHTLGTVVSDACGLADIYPVNKYPDAKIDAYLFTPCGFSANGVVPAPEGSGHYFTVHVTPEPQCSYASFETNVPAAQTGRETADIVEQVVKIFQPGRFSVTLFEAKPSAAEGGVTGYGDAEQEAKVMNRQAAKRSSRMETIQGYRRMDRIVHDLDGYDLVFRYYERFDWKGGAPRIGEIH